MSISVGDLVRYELGLYPGEDGLIYLVKEMNGDRCIIECVNTNMAIRPSSIGRADELHLYMEGSELIDIIKKSDANS